MTWRSLSIVDPQNSSEISLRAAQLERSTRAAIFLLHDQAFGERDVIFRVDVGDTTQTKSRSGQLTDATNFCSDVNLDGRINVGDTNLVKARSGTAIP